MDRAIEVNEDRKDFPEHPYKKPIRRGGRGSRGKGRNKIIYQENGAPIIKRPRLDEPQHSSAFPKPPNRGVTVRPVPQLITPSIQEMNARIRHYKEAAEVSLLFLQPNFGNKKKSSFVGVGKEIQREDKCHHRNVQARVGGKPQIYALARR